MRLAIPVLILFLGTIAVHASTLEKSRGEWAFRLSSRDQSVHGSYIFGRGIFQLGLVASNFHNDFYDEAALERFKGNAIGPVFTLNLAPENEKRTPFLFASVQNVYGRAGDLFDEVVTFGAGFKVFIGDSAAVMGFIQRINPLENDSFENLDQTALGVGVVLYTGQQ